ncbi:hypothetical protein SATMO3_29620 [Sporomusa aerivorans]
MHKRRLSASGGAVYNGRLRRALRLAPFVLYGLSDSQNLNLLLHKSGKFLTYA